jgi:hypothetical protein
MLKFFNRWLKLGSRREGTAEEVEHSTDEVSVNQEQDYSGIPDSLRGTDDEKSDTDTVTVRTLTLDDDSTYIVEEEDAGVDPYNTGRFDESKL